MRVLAIFALIAAASATQVRKSDCEKEIKAYVDARQ